jgi:hypothetical protein
MEFISFFQYAKPLLGKTNIEKAHLINRLDLNVATSHHKNYFYLVVQKQHELKQDKGKIHIFLD